MFDINFENIPDTLKAVPQWVLWAIVERDGKAIKIPIDPYKKTPADTTNPGTWSTYAVAKREVDTHDGYGLGFVFTLDIGIVGIDIDHCYTNGQLSESAYEMTQRVQSYAEISPSGTGLHIIVRATIPKSRRKNGVEFYNTARFFTVNGQHLAGTPAEIEECSESTLTLYHELFGEDDVTSVSGDGQTPHRGSGFPGTDAELIRRAQRGPGGFEFSQLWKGDWKSSGKYPSQSEADMALCSLLAWWTGPDEHRIERLFRQSGLMRAKWEERRGDKTYGLQTAEKIAARTVHFYQPPAGATEEGHGKEQQEPADLYPIIVTNKPLREISAEAVYALQLANEPPQLFTRSGVLVRVGQTDNALPRVETVTEPMLRGYMTRSANFFAVTEERGRKQDGEEPQLRRLHKFPARDVAADILSVPDKPFPTLVGITESPVLRPDGSIVTASGFDAATGLMYAGTAQLTVSAIPTQLEATASARFLCAELLHDFPFSGAADRANYLACLLTPIIRPAIAGCVPLCLIDKPTPGSGATLLADLVSVVATGRAAGKHTIPTGRGAEDEWGKLITSILMTGAPIVVLDNIGVTLASDKLCAALTSPTWDGRLLGTNTVISVPARTTWIATANNIAVGGDMARRCYRVWINPQVERPWTRSQFRHPNLLTWATDNRGALLSALLTIARAWVVAGRPPSPRPTAPLGSFDSWAHTVSGMLSYADVDGFLANISDIYAVVDEEDTQWREFFATWWELLGDREVTVRYLATQLTSNNGLTTTGLAATIPDSVGWDEHKLESSRKKLGNVLKKHANRVHGSWVLLRDNDLHNKVSSWRLKMIAV